MKIKLLISSVIILLVCSCKGQDELLHCQLSVADNIPIADYEVCSGRLTFDEINTDTRYTIDYPRPQYASLPIGVYNISGELEVKSQNETLHLKTAVHQYSHTGDSSLKLNWILYNPNNTLIFGEIYFTGSLNAKGTGGLFDTYFTIYNNTDEVQYADGIAIVESKLHNASTDIILTPENMRDANFSAQAIYVIPGTGKDVPILPGKSIKIVDQAIDWTEHVGNALDHTDADFEWYDESTSASVVDTDNPSVPNLDKWFCYTLTIWLPSNQCNRSYALVKFPEGMTMEKFLSEQKGEYDYINAATGIQMHAQNCYLIKHEWIIDGVNLCPTEKFTEPTLPTQIDRGFAAISDRNADPGRFGKKLVRKKSGLSPLGNIVLQDTDNSANDFDIIPAK